MIEKKMYPFSKCTFLDSCFGWVNQVDGWVWKFFSSFFGPIQPIFGALAPRGQMKFI